MPIVHGVPASPFVRKVLVALAEKGIEYENKPLSPFDKTPEFLRISPLGKIPVFQDGEFTIPDSSVILAYLERVHPEPPLYPADPREYARALFYEEYADTKFAEQVGNVFFNRIVKTKLMKQPSDETVVKEALANGLPPLFDHLELQVEGREFLAGGQFSVGDIAVTSQIQQLRHADEGVDASRWSRLAAYADGILSRPSFAACVEQEKKIFASM